MLPIPTLSVSKVLLIQQFHFGRQLPLTWGEYLDLVDDTTLPFLTRLGAFLQPCLVGAYLKRSFKGHCGIYSISVSHECTVGVSNADGICTSSVLKTVEIE